MTAGSIGSVVIVTGAFLRGNPRALKEAEALARAGYDASIVTNTRCSSLDFELAEARGFKLGSVLAEPSSGLLSFAASQWPRMQRRIALELLRCVKYETDWQISPRVSELYSRAKEAKADIYISHLEAGIWAGEKLLKSGFSVAVDMEDWFSEDLLPEARRNRPLRLLRRPEGELLSKGVFASCPSHAMSRALAAEFGCPPPAVIYNAFAWAERRSLDGLAKDRAERACPSIHWFSQTLGLGRGLEDLLAALPQVNYAADIHLRGNPVAGFANWLADRTPEAWRDRIFVHGLVPNHELLSRIAEHDIGFAGEMKYCRNKDLTVSNKLLQYLL